MKILLYCLFLSVGVYLILGLKCVSRKKSNTYELFSLFLSELLLNCEDTRSTRKVPEYEFFGELVAYVLEIGRKTGARPRQSLSRIKSSFIKEGIFRSKTRAILKEGHIQFILIASLTWSMIGLTWWLEIATLSLKHRLWIFGMQLSAFVFYGPLFNEVRRRKIQFLQVFLKRLYIFQINLSSNVSLKQSFNHSQLSVCFQSPQKRFQIYLKKLESLVSELQRKGRPIQEELENIKEELWNEYALLLEELTKSAQVLRLAIIFCLLLPSYFLYLYCLVSTFIV